MLIEELVTQRVMLGEPACPMCGGDYRIGETCTTLLGFSGSVNPNHVSKLCICVSCGFTFTVEEKSGNVWITKDGRVLAGMPNCFESYIYTCAFCGGSVARKHTKLDGITDVQSLLTTKDGPQYRTFYRCQACGRQIEVTEHEAE